MMDAMKDALKQKRQNGVSITLLIGKEGDHEGMESDAKEAVEEKAADEKSGELAPDVKVPGTEKPGMEEAALDPASGDIMEMLQGVGSPMARKAAEKAAMLKKGK